MGEGAAAHVGEDGGTQLLRRCRSAGRPARAQQLCARLPLPSGRAKGEKRTRTMKVGKYPDVQKKLMEWVAIPFSRSPPSQGSGDKDSWQWVCFMSLGTVAASCAKQRAEHRERSAAQGSVMP